ncbi:MAG: alpha/beta fold hydrolase [Anaerolineales bacterium]|jgi:pimeloyl-ACP methyl ester carboxylesterase
MKKHINGYDMAYTDAGSGPPLVFIHGFPLNRRMWQPQVDEFRETHRVIAPDLRGHGESQAVIGLYSMDLYAGDIIALLDHLKIEEKIVLCGLSMGGYICFELIRNFPDRLAGLVLTATWAKPDSMEKRAGRDQSASNVLQNGIEPLAEGMLPLLLSPETGQSNPGLVSEVSDILNSTSVEGTVGALQAMRDRPDSTPILSEINLPTLVIHGADDKIIPFEEAEKMAAQIPECRLFKIDHASHLPNLERPAEFNSAFSGLLQTL